MKKQPKAVYIIENGGYTELTYEEFCRREQICPLYADKAILQFKGTFYHPCGSGPDNKGNVHVL